MIRKATKTGTVMNSIKLVVILFFVFTSHLLFADKGGWVDEKGNRGPDTDFMKSKNGFGGWLVLTSDKDWKAKWNSSPSTIPKFTSAKKVKYGEQLTILIFYTNPKLNSLHEVNVVCDIKTTRPDGSYSVNAKDIKCARGRMLGNPRNVRLSRAIIKYIGEKKDPPGEWLVEVKLVDKIRNVELPLKAKFTLTK
jgi:hypothetical protein